MSIKRSVSPSGLGFGPGFLLQPVTCLFTNNCGISGRGGLDDLSCTPGLFAIEDLQVNAWDAVRGTPCLNLR